LLTSRAEAKFLLRADEEGLLSAQIENVHLAELRRFFEENYDIQFSGQDFIFQTTVTVSFEKLRMEQALKRILTRKNYAIKYNKEGEVLAVTVLPGTGDNPELAKRVNSATNTLSQKSLAQPQELLKEEELVADEITTFKPVKELSMDMPVSIQQKEFSVQVVRDNPLFKVEINSPPSEKML
jgi:hypothetical protein